ncbi:polysaccharide biosynthesis tyrosine autokinase [Rouxiella badensis]|uniref:polysaccharide biosynthesis tyrosine autokinase n=1 Tax=Rouxiella badensis TaxID=1646377 RepID=UPI001B43D0F0|nr:polysaccharide biosynthesis tyrosine autokinase [Rouxiella badensis]MCC3703435.1 polysaccharide biosynthesis tyrosine autokinase [Rouxiella badensis]MCC3718374.1 polysaccharide biosynthesis tyrosine autokinase [Rouxiella badensis]MCC3726858.1 polysaccharide biosynthesis tyrosine autokinase [Rouxiella badensis]MCC3731858.1 polysaccharide biosynthesis tyrosine autokinase [Rouxiella badensis]MCC3738793.1 polysaccharide biosynthesis tyrosine autokinase [Rouxiella badensis]
MSEKRDATLAKIENNANNLDLGRLYGAILDDRWLVVITVAVMMVFGVIFYFFATPIYSTDAMVQVESNPGSTLLNDIQRYLPDSQPKSDAQIKLIESKLVQFKTIEDLHLDIEQQEHFFPFFGKGWARLTHAPVSELEISKLDVPPAAMGFWLTFTVTGPNTYTLSNEGKTVLEGTVGEQHTQNGITITVDSMEAVKGTVFTVRKVPIRDAYDKLVASLSANDAGIDTGMIELKMKGENPNRDQKVLNSIANNFLLQNVERNSQEAANSLEFLKQQLPMVHKDLDDSEDRLNAYRQKRDSVDMSLEIRSALDTMVNLDNSLNELTFKEAEISQLYTPEHPTYRALLEKRKILEDEKAALNNKISQLPQTQQQLMRLTRNVDSQQEIFMQLLRKQQELSINKASTVGDVRIVDFATSEVAPVFPRLGLIEVMAAILGAMLAIIFIVMKIMMRRGIEGARELEEQGITVYANVPFASNQSRLASIPILGNLSKNNKAKKSREVLAITDPADLTVESLRSLRTSLHFAMIEAKNDILMITGAVPQAGKSFISVNLAAVIALTGKKVLLIDADMRRGSAHEYFGFNPRKGLSSVLAGQQTVSEVIHETEIPELQVITRGRTPPNPAELLTSKRFEDLLEWANQNYDLVVIDTPPVLSVTDASIIGQIVGTTMMVARFELNTVKEVEVSIKRLEQSGVNVKGCILNAIVRRSANYYSQNYSYDAFYTYEYKRHIDKD